MVGCEAKLVDLVAESGSRDTIDDCGTTCTESPGLDFPESTLELIISVGASSCAITGIFQYSTF